MCVEKKRVHKGKHKYTLKCGGKMVYYIFNNFIFILYPDFTAKVIINWIAEKEKTQ